MPIVASFVFAKFSFAESQPNWPIFMTLLLNMTWMSSWNIISSLLSGFSIATYSTIVFRVKNGSGKNALFADNSCSWNKKNALFAVIIGVSFFIIKIADLNILESSSNHNKYYKMIDSKLFSLPLHQQQTNSNNTNNSQSVPSVAFVMMTAPRRKKDAVFSTLLDTISSYIPQILEVPSFTFFVYTHFTEHQYFDAAMKLFPFSHYYIDGKEEKEENDISISTSEKTTLTINKGKGINWIRFSGSTYNLALHFSHALETVFKLSPNAEYIAVIEDDFPLCPNALDKIQKGISKAHHAKACGYFFGTGGAGLVIRRDLIGLISKELLIATVPADIFIQECLSGRVEPCKDKCASNGDIGLYVSSRLLLRHIGHDSSTVNAKYNSNEFQCGWRQPLNGDLDIGYFT